MYGVDTRMLTKIIRDKVCYKNFQISLYAKTLTTHVQCSCRNQVGFDYIKRYEEEKWPKLFLVSSLLWVTAGWIVSHLLILHRFTFTGSLCSVFWIFCVYVRVHLHPQKKNFLILTASGYRQPQLYARYHLLIYMQSFCCLFHIRCYFCWFSGDHPW